MNEKKYILDIKFFNEIVKGIKNMKSDLVCIYGNVLIGTDNTMANLKVYRLDIPIPLNPVCIITKELSSEFYSNIIDTIIIFDMDEYKIYCPNNKSYADGKNVMLTSEDIVINTINRYNNLLQNISNPSYKYIDFGDITNDDNFKYIKDLKSADGAKVYIPSKDSTYQMYLYKGALPMNKSDIVNMSIFDNGMTFITRFTIKKKKLNPIDVFFRFIKIEYSVSKNSV